MRTGGGGGRRRRRPRAAAAGGGSGNGSGGSGSGSGPPTAAARGTRLTLSAVDIIAQRREGGRNHNIRVAFEADHKYGLSERRLESALRLPTFGGELADEDFGPRAVVRVVGSAHRRHRIGVAIVVVVPRVAPRTGEARVANVRRPPPPRRDNLHMRVPCPHGLRDEVVVGGVLVGLHQPLLVADLETTQPKRRGVPHSRTHGGVVGGGGGAVGKVEHIDGVGGEGGALVERDVRTPHAVPAAKRGRCRR
jgi:hypothetical protein